MSSDTSSYQKHDRSTIHRHRELGAYDYGTVHSIVNECPILHVSFQPSHVVEDPFPTTLPMIGCMCSFESQDSDGSDIPFDVYVHGHSASRLMKLPESSLACSEGFPVCVSATILDGYVLALTPFHHTCNYRSVVIHGYAKLVSDEDERAFAMQRITDGLISYRWENSRVPPTSAELKSTSILRIRVQSASAKVNVGGPSDDRKDLKDPDVTEAVWTGVIPVWECLGEHQPGERNGVPDVPEYLMRWREDYNRRNEHYALGAIKLSNKH